MEYFARPKRRLWIHLVLFLVTLLTTTGAGALMSGVNPFSNPPGLVHGLPFSLTLMVILLVHEMGHYLTARHHGVPASLPYFIPAPTFIGTFGAFIRMEARPTNRRALFDVAAAGPLAGLVLAIPAVVIGLQLSTVTPESTPAGGITLGSSLLLNFLSKVTLGILPDEANIAIHPVAFAGWIGLFVTALNLLPVGQLDGGHVVYSLFGARHIWISRLAFVAILSLGVTRLWDGWLIWGLLLLFLGMRHPPALDAETPLDFKRTVMGWFVLMVFAVTFIPAPFSLNDSRPEASPVAPHSVPAESGYQMNGHSI